MAELLLLLPIVAFIALAALTLIVLRRAGRIVARDTPDGLKRRYDATSLEQVYLQTVSTSLPAVIAAEEER